MQDQSPSTDYSSLVNENALFERYIKNAFTGQVDEVLPELLQNSQRAHAGRVEIHTFEQGWWSYSDNGHGLLDGIDSLYTLLRWGESHYADQAVDQNQHPIGVGLYSLICLRGIHSIRIRSGSVSLWIETEAWLHDPEYRRSWPERVRTNDLPVPGFHLVIGGTTKCLEQVRTVLTRTASETYDPYFPSLSTCFGATQGYSDLLEVFLDDEQIQAPLPSWLTIPDADIVTAYQENLLRIKFARSGPKGVMINWYGQLIAPDGPLGERLPYQAYLEVRAGQPVHPMAPTRRGLIQDKSLTDLVLFVENAIFAHVLAQEAPSAQAIRLLYAVNAARAHRECPFLVVQRHWPLRNPDKIASLDTVLRWDQNGPVSVVHRDQLSQFLFLTDGIQVYRDVVPLLPPDETSPYEDPPSWEAEEFSYGLWSFTAATNLPAYRVLASMELPDELVHTLWWKPGDFEDKLYTRHPGEWGLGTWDQPPEEWQPLPADASVFAFDEAVYWSIDESEALIGTADIARFLHTWARIFWLRDDDEGDKSEEAYDESVQEMIISYLPNTILRTVPLCELPYMLRSLFSTQASTHTDVRSIEFVYDGPRLTSLRVQFANGQPEQVGLYPA